jgi:hypothetical protein
MSRFKKLIQEFIVFKILNHDFVSVVPPIVVGNVGFVVDVDVVVGADALFRSPDPVPRPGVRFLLPEMLEAILPVSPSLTLPPPFASEAHVAVAAPVIGLRWSECESESRERERGRSVSVCLYAFVCECMSVLT